MCRGQCISGAYKFIVLVQQGRIRAPVAPTQNQCGRVADARAGAFTCPQGDESQTHSEYKGER
ncbi:hypothetical protein KDAU_46080 [Dictyobacter aurantiacus]|uniref:Uncharacterized protein n=1 Tax=Dictyobacter aurantiacus TaxID=1936993 RepID=A0A401ZKA4_9CHLR|nr:hypothetical protein KDAU_46080 [Dictyobacter aurantiacus]